jgi:hypothetical protein
VDVGAMTVLVERRRDGDVLAWFLAVACGFAAWRGAAHAPVMAAGAGVLAAVALGAWIRWRILAPRELIVTRDDITFGRPGHQVIRIPRGTGPLEFRKSTGRGASLWLGPARDSGVAAIPMLGFKVPEVSQACAAMGWELRRLG